MSETKRKNAVDPDNPYEGYKCRKHGPVRPLLRLNRLDWEAGHRVVQRDCPICRSERRLTQKNTLRLEVLTAYGMKCACCEEKLLEFLCIDHIDGKGGEHRKQIKGSLYAWLKRNKFPKDNFQILCWNCSSAKYYYGRCPHNEPGARFGRFEMDPKDVT